MRLLESLAQIKDIQDFRLGAFMRSLGLDEKQPAILYRGLIKEARDTIALIARLEQAVAQRYAQTTKLQEKVASQTKELQQALATNRQFAEQNDQLRQMVSRLEKKAEIYDGLVAVLHGRWNHDSLSALFRLVADLHERACNQAIARAYGEGPLPPGRVPPGLKAKVRDLLYGRGLDALSQKGFQCPQCGTWVRLLRHKLEEVFRL